MHGEKRQHHADAADNAGRDQARVREFGVQAENTNDQEQEKYVGFDDASEKFLAAGQLEWGNDRIREHQFNFRSIEADDLAAVELMQQIGFRGRQQVDHLSIESFFFGKGLGVGNGSFRE